MKYDKEIDYTKGIGTPDYWEGCFFMPFKKEPNGAPQGSFEPTSEID